jgi:hypothetical protein
MEEIVVGKHQDVPDKSIEQDGLRPGIGRQGRANRGASHVYLGKQNPPFERLPHSTICSTPSCRMQAVKAHPRACVAALQAPRF